MGNKEKSALYAALLLGGVSFVLELFSGELPLGSILVFILAAIGNLVYGIPVSLLSDKITKNSFVPALL